MKSVTGNLEIRETFPPHDEFLRDFVHRSRPVIFTRTTEGMPACSTWGLDWLERAHGSVFLRARQLSVRDWIAKLKVAMSEGEIEYLSVPLAAIPGMAADLTLPRYQRLSSLLRIELWIGPGGTRTPVHCDYSENLFCQVVGRKRFQLYPPSAISVFEPALDFLLYRDYAPEYADHERDGRGTPLDQILASEAIAPEYDFVIEPGEVLYLPYRWYHRVSGLELSFSASTRWMTVGQLARRLPAVVANLVRGEPRRAVRRIRKGWPPRDRDFSDKDTNHGSAHQDVTDRRSDPVLRGGQLPHVGRGR